METKKYSIEEVKKHNSDKDIWVIIHDKVYDLTKFLKEHPGGEEILLEFAGKEATQEFEDVGHSDMAKEIMEAHYIGDIVDEQKRSKTKPGCSKGSSKSCVGVLGGFSALAIALGAMIIYKGYKMGNK